ncbi:MAG: hypothetical protein R8M14_04560 [Ghiorsea sp.]
MFKDVIKKLHKKSLSLLALGMMMTGCVISFSPPELSNNFPKKFDAVPIAKALPAGVKIDIDDTFNDQAAMDDVLESSTKIGVAKFNVHFITEDRVSATTGDGGAAVMDVSLEGVMKTQFQAITNAAYADFVAQLKASGREIIPVETIQATSGYRGINFDGPSGASENTGMDTQILTTQEKRIITTFSTTGLPGWHIDPLGVGNQAVFPWISGEAHAAIINVDITVNFIETSSSGRGSAWFSSDASVNAKPSIKIINVKIDGHFTDNPPGGVMGSYVQNGDEPIIVNGDFGIVKSRGGSKSKSLNKSRRAIVANPNKFKSLVLKGIQSANAAFVSFVNDNKP